jgi:hypothetical protein
MPTEETRIAAERGFDPPDPAAFVEDRSCTNGSSIAFLLECQGIRALFLGDSWPSVVAKQWEKLPHETRGALDMVKVSHHGSRHNTSPALLQLITAKTYVFSTDGSKHDQPNLETLLWVADANPPGTTFVFNYPSGPAEHMDKSKAKARFGHTVKMGDGKGSVAITRDGEVECGTSEN